MERYMVQQRIQIIQLYYENGRKAIFHKLRDFYPLHNRPSESTISRILKEFEETGTIADIKTQIRHPSSRTPENTEAVRESDADEPRMLIPHRSQ